MEALDTRAAVPAGFWIRAGAQVVDLFFLFFAVVFVLGCADGVRAAFQEEGGTSLFSLLEKHSWIDRLLTYVAFAVYHAISECVLGGTVGKRLFGLRVVDLGLKVPAFRQTVVRSAAFIVDTFLFAIVAAQAMGDSPIRQRVGDRWADTRVVRQRSLPDSPWPPGVIFTFVTIGALGAAADVFLLGAYLLFLAWVSG